MHLSSRDPAEVIARALDLLDEDETWSPKERYELNQHLSASLASSDHGELCTAHQSAVYVSSTIFLVFASYPPR